MNFQLLMLFSAALFCDVCRQLCFKFASIQENPETEPPERSPWNSFKTHLGEVFGSGYSWAGMAICAVEIVLWLVILEWVPLNMAYPIMSLDFCLVLFAARLVLNEEISPRRFAGSVLIAIGVALVGWSGW